MVDWKSVPDPKEEGEVELEGMTKEEALARAAALIRDPDVQANQKGPLLSAMARVAGWETAPEYDWEGERAKWMGEMEKMVRAGEVEEKALRRVLGRYPAARVELAAMLGGE